MFFSSYRQFKPIAVPRPVVLQQVQTLRVHTNDWAVACSVQQWGVIYTSGEIAIAMQPATRTWRSPVISRACTRLCLAVCSTVVKVLCSTAATAQLAVHTKTKSSGFVGNLIPQRHSRCRTLSQNVQLSTIEPSRGECQALRARPERGVCTPHQCSSPAPTFLTVGSKKHRRRQR